MGIVDDFVNNRFKSCRKRVKFKILDIFFVQRNRRFPWRSPRSPSAIGRPTCAPEI